MSEEISKSKAKREQRKSEAAAEKRKRNLDSIIGWIVGIVIAGAVIAAIGLGIYQSVTKTVSDNNFSAGLTSEGRIKGADLSKVNDIGLDSLSIAYADIEYTDELVDNVCNSQTSSFAEYKTDADLTVQDGDYINLDYVGYMDDVAFEGGSTDGNGTTLIIGSGQYIDTFEQQLIGHHPGESVTVNVTFPDPYENNPSYAGKAARFECVINSIKVTPEFTDEFVADKLSEYATTVDGYREYIKTMGEKSNIQNYISKLILENASAKAPSSYVKHLRQLTKYSDEQTYTQYNNMYLQYYGQALYKTFQDYTGMTDAEYEADLKSTALKNAAADMTYEAFFVNKGLSISDETYNTILENAGGETAISTYGEAYIRQVALKQTVLEYLTEHATINR